MGKKNYHIRSNYCLVHWFFNVTEKPLVKFFKITEKPLVKYLPNKGIPRRNISRGLLGGGGGFIFNDAN